MGWEVCERGCWGEIMRSVSCANKRGFIKWGLRVCERGCWGEIAVRDCIFVK
jgi:hypothetical protein